MRALLVSCAALLNLPLAASAAMDARPSQDDAIYLPYAAAGGWNIIVGIAEAPECFAYGKFQSGMTMRLGIENDAIGRSAFLVMSNPQWNAILPDQKYDIQVRFDQKKPFEIAAISGGINEPPSLTLRLDDQNFARAFALSTAMYLNLKGQELARLALGSPAAAIIKMGQCQSDIATIMAEIDEDNSAAGHENVI